MQLSINQDWKTEEEEDDCDIQIDLVRILQY